MIEEMAGFTIPTQACKSFQTFQRCPNFERGGG